MPSTPPRGDDQSQIPDQIVVGTQGQPSENQSSRIPEPSQTPRQTPQVTSVSARRTVGFSVSPLLGVLITQFCTPDASKFSLSNFEVDPGAGRGKI